MLIYSAATFRTIGAAATTQNLFSIWNGSDKVVRLLKLSAQSEATVVLTAVAAQLKASRISAAPTGGLALTKVAWESAAPASESTVLIRGESATDGGARTPLVVTPGSVLWSQYVTRIHTAVGQLVPTTLDLLPHLSIERPLVLRKNEGLVVHLLADIGTSNPATNHYIVQALWGEGNN